MLKPLTLTFLLILFFSCQNKEQTLLFSIEKINALQKRIDTLENDSSFFLLKKIDSVLDKNPSYHDSMRAENYSLWGDYYKKRGDLDSAAVYFYQATEFVDSIYGEKETNYFRDAWNTYRNIGRFGDCFVVSKKFRSLLDTSKQNRALYWALTWDSNIYMKMKRYDEAAKISQTLIKLAKEKDTASIPISLLGYADLNFYYLENKKEAFRVMDSLLSIEKKLTDNSRTQVHNNYGTFLYYKKDYKGALSHYLKALAILKKDTLLQNYVNKKAIYYNNIAEVLIDLKQFDESRKYLDSVKALGINQIEERLRKSLFSYELRLAVETNKDTKRLFALLDTLLNNQNETYAKKFNAELLALTQANEKEKQLLQEKQQSELQNARLTNRILLLSISIGLFALLGYMLYQRKSFLFERQQLQNQQRLLRSQMNPHFTFNTLYAIQNELKARPEEAGKHLLTFSRLLRLTLENSTQNFVQLEKELEALEKYLELQRVRHPSAFTYEIILENVSEDDLVFIPPMLLQPFVENSIEHGFMGIDYLGKLKVTLRLEEAHLHCTIDDNGRGLSHQIQPSKKSTSIALISDFILKATKQKLSIQNKQEIDPNTTGTLVTFLIPFKHTEND
ncbi:MAG: histidine kinase [Flavobacteriaceae bacterium]